MASKVFTAIVSGFRKLKEPNCWSISFHTQEIPKETAMELSDFLDQIVKVVISDSNISYEVIEQVEAVDIKEKEKWTPSQKLRFAIRELQGRQGLHDQDHNEYYREWIIKFINHINKIE